MRDIRLDMDFLGVLYELPQAERWALEEILNRYGELRKSNHTAQSLAVRWQISERLVRRLAQSGALEGKLRRNKWEFSAKAVERYEAAHTYQGGVRVELPKAEPIGRRSAELLSRTHADLEDMDWTVRDLANHLDVGRDFAYQLILSWRSAGAVDHGPRRGWYHFTAAVLSTVVDTSAANTEPIARELAIS
ncbi:MAG TPA: hypothetical protein VFU22_19020 [Roseiflexaceae bacterium]|nr:hypothetical protein [Roseiflexaceae bacterium]